MVGKILEQLRKQKGVTRKEVAEILKIDQSTYGKYELNKREPNNETLIKIADYFNVSTDYLLGKGVFAQKDLIIEHRELITAALKEMVGEEMAQYSKTVTDDEFILALSMIVNRVEYDPNAPGIIVYYYLNPKETIEKNTLVNMGISRNYPIISGINENGKYVKQFSEDEALGIIKDLAHLPDEATEDLKLLFEFLDMKYNKGK